MLTVNLLRAYGDRGTNGEIWIGDGLVCYTIELPGAKTSVTFPVFLTELTHWPSDTANDLDGTFW